MPFATMSIYIFKTSGDTASPSRHCVSSDTVSITQAIKADGIERRKEPGFQKLHETGHFYEFGLVAFIALYIKFTTWLLSISQPYALISVCLAPCLIQAHRCRLTWYSKNDLKARANTANAGIDLAGVTAHTRPNFCGEIHTGTAKLDNMRYQTSCRIGTLAFSRLPSVF